MNKTFSASAALLLAKCLSELFPLIQLVRSGTTPHGFYSEFAFQQPLDDKVLPIIEERARALIKADLPLHAAEMLGSNAVDLFRHLNRPQQVQRLLDAEGLVSLGRIDDFWDLIKGPFLESSGEIKAFKLLAIESLNLSGLKGFRIEGVAFGSKDELKSFTKVWSEIKRLNILERALQKKLWTGDNLAECAVWLPFGSSLQHLLLKPWRQFCHLWNIPIVNSLESLANLKCGLSCAAEVTFHTIDEAQDDEYTPIMNPEWFLSDLILLERNELSRQQIIEFLSLQQRLFSFFKLPFTFKGSQKPFWIKAAAEASIEMIADETYQNGIYLSVGDRLGAERNCGSVTARGNKISLSLLGPLERLVALLLERGNGELPLSLVPEQVRLFAVGEEADQLALEYAEQLQSVGIRVAIDQSRGELKERMRSVERFQPTYTAVIGPREAAKKMLTLRLPKGKEEWLSIQQLQERIISSLGVCGRDLFGCKKRTNTL